MIRNFLLAVFYFALASFCLFANAEWIRLVKVDDFDGTKTIVSAVRSQDGTWGFVVVKSESSEFLGGTLLGLVKQPKCFGDDLPRAELRIDDVTLDDTFIAVTTSESRIIGIFSDEVSVVNALDKGTELKILLNGCNYRREVMVFDISGTPDLNF